MQKWNASGLTSSYIFIERSSQKYCAQGKLKHGRSLISKGHRTAFIEKTVITAQSAINCPYMTNVKKKKKTKKLTAYVLMYKIINEKQICYTATTQTTTTVLQAPNLGQTQTEYGGVKLVYPPINVGQQSNCTTYEQNMKII